MVARSTLGLSPIRTVVLLLVGATITLTFAGHSSAQRGWQRGWGRNRDPRNGVPTWENDLEYKQDVFTFCRVRFDSRTRWGWQTDYPDSDLNFSFRLQQLTSLKVDPDGVIHDLTDPEIFNYPFIYMCEPGGLVLSKQEEVCLRKYLLNGGFLMADDFWGSWQWESFAEAIYGAFPDRQIVDLSIDHPIFHTVYDLQKKPQVPNVQTGENGRGMGPGGTNISWENREPGSREVHYRGLFDDNNRLMAIFCHNTDLGDGWEREGMYEWFFHEYSEKQAYPMGINIVVYAMTH
jgi:hypothetical protein